MPDTKKLVPINAKIPPKLRNYLKTFVVRFNTHGSPDVPEAKIQDVVALAIGVLRAVSVADIQRAGTLQRLEESLKARIRGEG